MKALQRVLAAVAMAAVPTGLVGRAMGEKPPLRGSHQHTIHASLGGHTYRSNSKRSRDRADRRSGRISARQQRIQRKAFNQQRRVA